MGYLGAHAPVYGYMKGYRHTIQLHLVHYARTLSIFKLLNTIRLGKVLNVGGADGYQSYLIRKIFGVDVVTLDMCADALEIAKTMYGLETVRGSALALPFANDSFDTVICIETIEHIHDSQQVVSELKRVAKNNVVISTESFFESERQKQEFLLYLHETHPQFFRNNDPMQPSDVSYFTKNDFFRLFGTENLSFLPQFSSKQAEILADIKAVRAHVRAMTENDEVNKRTKVIVHYCQNALPQNENAVAEEVLLEEIVREGPVFPLELDAEMIREDADNLLRITQWHAEKKFCRIEDAARVDALPIEEEGAAGMSLQWLTTDDLERSPQFCMRKVTLDAMGKTPFRKTAWEHQLYILSGEGRLIENDRETALRPDMVVFVRPNVAFRLENSGGEVLVYLDIIPSITHYFGR